MMALSQRIWRNYAAKAYTYVRQILAFIKSAYLFAFFLGSTSSADAEISFFKLSSPQLIAPLIIPVRPHEEPLHAWENYLKQLSTNSDLVELFEGRLPYIQVRSLQPLSAKELADASVVIMNSPRDFTNKIYPTTDDTSHPHENRIHTLSNTLKELGSTQTFLLPIAAGIGFTHSEYQDFKNKIADEVRLLISPGGDDVHTSFYKQPSIWANYTNATRDKYEISLIQTFTRKQKGFILGICRGMQITSVALGYKLVQDIPHHFNSPISHREYALHPVTFLPTTHNLLLTASGSALNTVNSLHHQSVILHKNGPLELAAHTSDGITEGAEFKNGKGLLVQFHPELLKFDLGKKVLSQVTYKVWPKLASANVCQKWYQ
ncbi:MAG: gamma-glutamyl-gamma-aminobutyrate hydrolase family protein [Bdellovibrionaceae bacterium]|nr:gamma-glutamyl-gamma-aminobutyrate hydrolase family protein [Pseudobdellovibrionaceae bacterium]